MNAKKEKKQNEQHKKSAQTEKKIKKSIKF